MRRLTARCLVVPVVLALVPPPPALAWNGTGHRVIAEIAYRRLDEPTRRRVAEALKAHPAYAALWANRPNNGPDEALNLFMNAALFPDDARRPPFDRYNRPKAHYVNFRILADEDNRVEPPVDPENILNDYVANLRKVGDPKTAADERALALSWIFHQEGDIHMPLHAVSRFSKAFPEGDRGGNLVRFPNPWARPDRNNPRVKFERDNNLHAYWDSLLGNDESPEAVGRLAAELTAEYPADALAEGLARAEIKGWAEESVGLCLGTVYRGLDPAVARFEQAPAGYEAAARKVARRQVALAGYRMAKQLDALFGSR